MWRFLAALCLIPAVSWAGCDPSCPTCQAAINSVKQKIALLDTVGRPIIGPEYVCHNPNWQSENANLSRWAGLIQQIAPSINYHGFSVPPLFVAAEMNDEDPAGNPDIAGPGVPNRALSLMQTLPPAEEQDAMSFNDVRGRNGWNGMPTAWPRTRVFKTPPPSAAISITMGVQDQDYCAGRAGGLDPAAIAACYNQGPAAGLTVAAAHNDYQVALAKYPGAAAYVTRFLSFAHCQPVAPTASTPYRKYP